jgi:uncharacterized protein
MAAYIGGVLFVTMVLAGIVMDLAFTALGLVPAHQEDVRAHITHVALNYTFWLNLVFGALAISMVWLNRRHPMNHHHHCHAHGHADHDHAGHAHHEHAPHDHAHHGA